VNFAGIPGECAAGKRTEISIPWPHSKHPIICGMARQNFRHMNKEDIPQDDGALNKLTKEMVYAVDSNGKYITELSTGWNVKATALDAAWKDIEERVESARQKVIRKEASPLLYFMELRLMDIGIVSAYTGFWKWTIKRHLKPSVFDKLSEKKLQRYAATFNIALADLKTMNVHED
jgi:hypothetical protein